MSTLSTHHLLRTMQEEGNDKEKQANKNMRGEIYIYIDI